MIYKSSKYLLVFCGAVLCFALPAYGQQDGSTDSVVVVQPGAPGKATQVLPTNTTAKLPPVSPKDVEFMQGMIMHHAQAVEMVALMKARTNNEELLLLGARISQSQADEINMMKRWLAIRGEKTSMPMPKMDKMDMSGMSKHDHNQMLMPGMLSPKQMEELAAAKGNEFDRLFLTGMIQHHGGALVMVDELFKNSGAGEEAQIFNFATDIDSSQRAEIRIMQGMLGEKP
ncbi:MAG: DUF305 domain-containing protein [Acidobacteria bacterium]|nr:DUF305 domain-containing protein [Acidobacteriota bacterium]